MNMKISILFRIRNACSDQSGASGINGVGPVKRNTVIPQILGIIKKLRSENIGK